MCGAFIGILTWDGLSRLWTTVLSTRDQDWYVYSPGKKGSAAQVNGEALEHFVLEMDALLRKRHRETYCGIVYTDSVEQPELVKIYDPYHLGSSDSCSTVSTIVPGWVLTRFMPEQLHDHSGLRKAWKHWWGK